MFRRLLPVIISAILIGACAPAASGAAVLPGEAHLALPALPAMSAHPAATAGVQPPRAPLPIEAAAPSLAAPGLAGPAPRQAPLPAVETQPDSASAPAQGTTTRLPIVEYHYSTFKMGAAVRMESEWFRGQLAWLSANDFQTLTAEQLAAFVQGAYQPPARSAVLTFDVGASRFSDYATVVIPALRRYHLHAIFFILASRTVDSCADPDLTCWPMVKQWADEGLISVGSHSWSHLDYQTLTPETIYWDAAHSKALIEQKTGHPVLGICYPFDSVNPAAFDLLKSLGYRWAVGGFTQADRSAHAGAAQPYNLPRYYPYSGDYYPVIGGAHGQTFEQMMLGAIDPQ